MNQFGTGSRSGTNTSGSDGGTHRRIHALPFAFEQRISGVRVISGGLTEAVAPGEVDPDIAGRADGDRSFSSEHRRKERQVGLLLQHRVEPTRFVHRPIGLQVRKDRNQWSLDRMATVEDDQLNRVVGDPVLGREGSPRLHREQSSMLGYLGLLNRHVGQMLASIIDWLPRE